MAFVRHIKRQEKCTTGIKCAVVEQRLSGTVRCVIARWAVLVKLG